MPQEMNVLCCYSCKMYQVHIVKKARKWQCKLCNAKQSVQQIYLQGSGRDCRLYVQELNSLKENDIFSLVAGPTDTNDNYNASTSMPRESYDGKAAESKWAKYLESSEGEDRLFDAQDVTSRGIYEAEDVLPGENLSCDDTNIINDDSWNFEDIPDDSNVETEGREVDKCEVNNWQSASCSRNSDSDDKRGLQEKSKFNGDFIEVANIFESNEELEPI